MFGRDGCCGGGGGVVRGQLVYLSDLIARSVGVTCVVWSHRFESHSIPDTFISTFYLVLYNFALLHRLLVLHMDRWPTEMGGIIE